MAKKEITVKDLKKGDIILLNNGQVVSFFDKTKSLVSEEEQIVINAIFSTVTHPVPASMFIRKIETIEEEWQLIHQRFINYRTTNFNWLENL